MKGEYGKGMDGLGREEKVGRKSLVKQFVHTAVLMSK